MKKNKYSDTLNLPHTDFPMRANLAKREPALFQQWDQQNVYQKLVSATSDRPSFVLHDGPPYANGSIHLGHAVNKVLKDIIVKSKAIAGFRFHYIPGWDCHGLPIEMKIEKQYGKVGDKLDARQFRQHCRQYADQQIETQKIGFKRLGIIGDWNNPYQTKDFQVEANEVLALKRLYEQGFIRRGLKSVYWSTGCQTALAEAELEYKDKFSQAIDVGYEVQNLTALEQAFGCPIKTAAEVVIWTTTPWTLPASRAIAVNPNLTYALCRTADKHLVLAKDLVTSCAERYQLKLEIVAECLGSQLTSVPCQHPYLDERSIALITSEHVTTEAGTGCVHTAPAHGPEDFELGLQYQLDTHCPVDKRGHFYEHTPLVAGLFVAKAEGVIIEALKQRHKLYCLEKFQHSYPHCWRSKTPIIFRATNQWFISMQGILDKALDSLQHVAFTPSWGQDRMQGMLHNRPDWCISRQRYWGVPIAFVTHKQTNQMHPDIGNIMIQVADKIRQHGIDAWFDMDLQELIGSQAEHYQKCSDVLDVWFDSGLTHQTLERQQDGLSFPVDLYLEGSDQHRGWFQSSLLTGIALNGQPPYQGLLTHGFTVDAEGRKMSKSEGNNIEPDAICQSLGADILRLWIASTDYRQEMSISTEIFQRVSESYRRIRNTLRYFLSNLNDFNPATNLIPPKQLLKMDFWMLTRAASLQHDIQQAYEKYEFHHIVRKIQTFCSIELGAFYLDILKDRLYTCQANSLARRSAQSVLWHLCQCMVRWLAPILSFTSDEVWQHLKTIQPNQQLLLASRYYELPELPPQQAFDDSFWQGMQQLKTASDKQLEKLRQDGQIGSSLDAEITLFADQQWQQTLDRLGDELRFLLITSYAHLKPLQQAPEQAEQLPGLVIVAKPCNYPRCERSWHRRQDVGSHPNYADLDARSILNAYGEGEQRYFV